MSYRDYMPTREGDLANWLSNFNTLIAATPTVYGLTAAQATAFAAAHAAWVAAYAAAVEPATRTASAVAAKNDAKAAVVALARQYARIVQATPTVTSQQRIDLGLTVRDVEPSPSHAPAFAPGIGVVSVFNRTARVRLTDAQNPTRRGKPDGVAGASIYSYVGETPPADLTLFKAEGNTSRTTVDVVFPNSVAPGAKVWIAAAWFSPRFQSGPASTPVTTNLPGNAAQAA